MRDNKRRITEARTCACNIWVLQYNVQYVRSQPVTTQFSLRLRKSRSEQGLEEALGHDQHASITWPRFAGINVCEIGF